MPRSERELVEWKQQQARLNQKPKHDIWPRVAALDPGKQQDRFAMVGIEIRDKKDIYIIGANEWKLHEDYEEVEEQVRIINNVLVKRPFDHIAVETNNSGWHVVEALRKKNMPIIPVNTAKNIKDKKKLILGNTMDKNDMVRWLQRMIQANRLHFPEQHSNGTLALYNQMPKMTKKITDAGNVSYSAQGREHDDLVMALILACYIARRRYLRGFEGQVPIVLGGRKKPRNLKTAADYFPEIASNPYNKIQNYSISGPT